MIIRQKVEIFYVFIFVCVHTVSVTRGKLFYAPIMNIGSCIFPFTLILPQYINIFMPLHAYVIICII